MTFKFAIASIFLVLLPFLGHVTSFEMCQVDDRRTLFCLSGFCCGTCNFRFCCDNPLLAINQTQCAMCMGYSMSYTDGSSQMLPPVSCDPSLGEFCCGSCTNRYCCGRKSRRLDQSICLNNLISGNDDYENNYDTGNYDTTTTSTTTTTPATDSTTTNAAFIMSTATTTQSDYDFDWFNNWFRSTRPPNSYWSDPNRTAAKWILVFVGIFCFVITFILVVALVNKRQQERRFAAVVAAASAAQTKAATNTSPTTISTIEMPSSTNIQDIHTMYNSDLSLLPNYDSINKKEPKIEEENEVPK